MDNILFSVENSFSFGAFSLATKPFSSDSQLAETPHKGGYPLECLEESADTKFKIKNTLGDAESKQIDYSKQQ